MNTQTTTLFAAAVSTLLLAGCQPEEMAQMDDMGFDQTVRCAGINECAGTSECAGGADGEGACQGLNECAGQGWITADSEQACLDDGGDVLSEA